MKTRGIIFSLLLFGFFQAAEAAEDPFLQRIHLWIGGDGGYSRIVPGRAGELTKNGYQLDASGFLSYSWEFITVEAGGGWLYNVSEGEVSSGPVLNDKITTKAGFAHLVGRYRLSPEWEVGLANRILFGADTRFQTSGPVNNHVHWLMGLEGAYRVPLRLPLQITGTALTDVTISGRQIYQFFIGLHIGFELFDFSPNEAFAPSRTREVQKVTVEKTTEKTQVVEVPVPIVVPAKEPKRTYIFDLQRIQFDFDSAKLRPRSQRMLLELGTFLAEHHDAWTHLTIEGHTDRIGTHEYNLGLSQRRADSVRNELLRHGVRPEAVLAKGLSFTEPLVEEKTPDDRQRNRRVEFEFEGIHEPEKLDEFFRHLNADY